MNQNDIKTYATLETTNVESVVDCMGQIFAGMVPKQFSEVDK
jgi:hypothetical protein